MKTKFPSRRRFDGFTLIELLTVMAIIVILAGLILGTAGFATHKAATSRAQGEIKGLETAINSYQVDNGSVPRDNGTTNYTDKLDARADATGSSGGTPGTTYQQASLFLFRALSGYYDVTTNPPTPITTNTQKTYFPFKGNQVYPATATNADGSIAYKTVTYIVDPFGQSYGYSTAAILEAEQNTASGNTAAQTKGYNPTYDLWSTAGYGVGKPYPTSPALPDKSTLWITNWTNQ